MYTLIIAAIVGALIGLSVSFRRESRDCDGPIHRFVGRPLGYGCGGAFIGFFLAALVSTIVPAGVHYERYGTYKLACLNTASGVDGEFFLGSGSVNGSSQYEYLVVDKDSSLVPGSVARDGYIRIFPEDRKDAQLIIWHQVRDRKYARFLPICPGNYVYDFHLPPGSVQNNFNVR